STIESARLALHSALDQQLPATGRYLAEHVERRARIELRLDEEAPSRADGISLVLPPLGNELADRFQLHLRGEIVDRRNLRVDIGGFAAMDPNPDNRVTLSRQKDDFGLAKAYTRLVPSAADNERIAAMCARIHEVAKVL